MDAFQFIERIKAAGFTLEAEESGIAISPASKLTDTQRQFIRSHKPAIVAALSTKPPTPAPDATEADLARAEHARNLSHAGWVWHEGRWHAQGVPLAAQDAQKPEPLHTPHPEPQRAPTAPTFAATAVRCADCGHAQSQDYHPALVTCGAGREPAAACGAFWKFDSRDCGCFEPITASLETEQR